MMLMSTCKPCLEKSSRAPTKFINYLQGFYAIAISENTSEQDVDDSMEETYRGVPLQQIWMPITFPKKLYLVFFCCFFLVWRIVSE